MENRILRRPSWKRSQFPVASRGFRAGLSRILLARDLASMLLPAPNKNTGQIYFYIEWGEIYNTLYDHINPRTT